MALRLVAYAVREWRSVRSPLKAEGQGPIYWEVMFVIKASSQSRYTKLRLTVTLYRMVSAVLFSLFSFHWSQPLRLLSGGVDGEQQAHGGLINGNAL